MQLPCAWAPAACAVLRRKRPGPVYLFTSFRDADQKYLRFLYSFDGYNWTNVPGTFLEAKVGRAKNFVIRAWRAGRTECFIWSGRRAGAATRVSAAQIPKDLIHWSEQQFVPVMTNEPATVNVWAPELFYDAPADRFIITWASTIPGRFPDKLEKHDNNHRLYYTTTRDFTNVHAGEIVFRSRASA